MKHLQITKAIFFFLMMSFCLSSCSKEDLNENKELTSITVKFKSTVGELQNVFIEIKDVQLRIKSNENAPNAWISLNTINHGAINTSILNEGSELLLVDTFQIESTDLYEIRLVLGNNNFININNTLHSLDINNLGNSKPSNLLETDLEPNRFYNFIIDIDLDRSVSFNEAENMMILNPFLYTAIRQFHY